MEHDAKGEVAVWREFADRPETLAFESERLLAERLGKPIEQVADVDARFACGYRLLGFQCLPPMAV